jgi:hypothetical protein
MPCCGEKRQQIQSPISTMPTSSQASSNQRFIPRSNGTLRFKYLGLGRLTVMGPASGRQYVFNSPGEIVTVDARDQPWLSSVPKLQLLGY